MATDRPPGESKLSLAEVVAIGIGGMVGGGIFAVLGLAMEVAGNAVPVAMALGGLLALLTGYSMAHLGLAFRGDGGSFTYIEHAFATTAVAGVAGWLLVAGYVGTLALYASAFGAYGSVLLSSSETPWVTSTLSMAVIVVFLAINLIGTKTSGRVELAVVAVKVAILGLFAMAGATSVQSSHLFPVFDLGIAAPLMAAGLIFVAYEGFELIPNAIDEMKDPERNLKRGLILAIVITTLIYVVVSLVASGTLTADQVQHDREYVLAVAARPTLGQAGFVLIGVAALMSTASAINATLFGAARLAMVLATEHALPRVFSLRERTRNVPWVSLVALSALTIAFVLSADLPLISSFASATFLIIFTAVNLSAFRLHARIGVRAVFPLSGAILSGAALATLLWHMWQTSTSDLLWVAATYLAAVVFETLLVLFRGWRPLAAKRDRAPGRRHRTTS